MKRARSDEQKGVRRQAILDAAAVIFRQTYYDHITLNLVASAAQLGKATLYTYFETKEELFLSLYQQFFESWFVDAHTQLAGLAAPSDAQSIANVITQVFKRHQDLLRLFSIVHTTLEANVNPNALAAYKEWLYPRLEETSALMESKFSNLPANQGRRITRYMYSLLLGFTHIATPSRPLEGAVPPAQVDWLDEFSEAFTALLLGLERQFMS